MPNTRRGKIIPITTLMKTLERAHWVEIAHEMRNAAFDPNEFYDGVGRYLLDDPDPRDF